MGRDGAEIEALTHDADLRGIGTVRASDFNDLRRRLTRVVEDFAESRYGTAWQPAILLETGVHQRQVASSNNSGACRTSLVMSMEFLRAAPRSSTANTPTRAVLRGATQHMVTERGRQDTFPKGDSIAERAAWWHETETPVARILVADNDDHRASLEALSAVLCHFGGALADRLSPGRVHDGLPEPEELVAMMREAVDAHPATLSHAMEAAP